MSNEVIFLSDIPNHSDETYAARYAGPYVLKSQLLDAGHKTIVLDWFRFKKDNDDFFTYFENLIDKNTLCVGITTTFLYPNFQNKKLSDSSGFSSINTESKVDKLTAAAYSLYLWEYTNEELYEWFKRLRKTLDKYNPNAKIILGGARTTRILQMSGIAPKDYAVKDFCDYVLCGMADNAIIQLVNKLKNKEDIKPSIERNGIKFILCDREEWKSDTTVVPRSYFTKEDCLESSHWAPLEVSRGCGFNCKYCYYETRYSSKRNVNCIKEELISNYNEFGTTGYNITSDCFNDNRRWVGEWAEMVATLPFKIEWSSYVRIDPFHKYIESMDEMIDSGYRAGFYGIETLCHVAGKAAGKGLNPDRVKELLQILKDKGGDNIWTTAYFILGLPKETHKSLDDTLKWLMTQKIIDEVQTSILDVGPFIEELAGVVDFSDHSRYPEKFGFTKLEFDPKFYWEHETMNLDECFPIQEKWKKTFENHPFTRFGGSAHGEYARIRDTGLSHKESVTFMKTKFLTGNRLINMPIDKKKKFKNHVIELSRQNVDNYYNKFLQVNRVR
jgi:radical SAM superfamily enzyme YgiQ (UPF0313 family)